MPIVTISRQYGAGGSSVAALVAADIGAEVVDKKLIEEVATRLSIRPSEVEAEAERPRSLLDRLVRSLSSLEPSMGAGWTPPYSDPLYDPRKSIIKLTEQIVREVAQNGNVVIVGRGAGFVLRDRVPAGGAELEQALGAILAHARQHSRDGLGATKPAT